MIIYKPLGNEISIGIANSVVTTTNIGVGCLLRIFNTATTANLLHFKYANGTEYANLTISPQSIDDVIVWKNNTDLLIGNSMIALPIAYQGI